MLTQARAQRTYSVDEASVMHASKRKWLLARKPDGAWPDALAEAVRGLYTSDLTPALRRWHRALRDSDDVARLFEQRYGNSGAGKKIRKRAMATIDKLLPKAAGDGGLKRMLALCGEPSPPKPAKATVAAARLPAVAEEDDGADQPEAMPFVPSSPPYEIVPPSYTPSSPSYDPSTPPPAPMVVVAASPVQHHPPTAAANGESVVALMQLVREQQQMAREQQRQHRELMDMLRANGAMAPAAEAPRCWPTLLRHRLSNSSGSGSISSSSAAGAVAAIGKSECPVCMEAFTDVGDRRRMVTPCGHSVCHECSLMLLSKSTKSDGSWLCMVCRKPVTQLIQIFT